MVVCAVGVGLWVTSLSLGDAAVVGTPVADVVNMGNENCMDTESAWRICVNQIEYRARPCNRFRSTMVQGTQLVMVLHMLEDCAGRRINNGGLKCFSLIDIALSWDWRGA